VRNFAVCGGNQRRGFTTGELLISVALLAVVITLTIGLFVMLMNASTKGLDQTVAIDICQNKLDQAAQSSANKWVIYNSEAHSVTDPRSPTTFHYILNYDELTEHKTKAMGDMYRLDMEVYWWPEDPNQHKVSTRVEMGRLSVRLSRVVYVQNMKP